MQLTSKMETVSVLCEVPTKVLCAFAELRKATINSVVSVRLSAPTGRFFMEFDT